MGNGQGYSYRTSIKSSVSDELINIYLLRPLAGYVVRAVYPTAVTPNQLTAAAIFVGACGAILYSFGTHLLTLIAGLCVTLKDLLDSADGQLARARQQYSRAGRFLDSIGDILVNFLVFGAISSALIRPSADVFPAILGLLGFLGITLRVSYHVFYQTSFLHLSGGYPVNRITEELREEDLVADQWALRLQKLYGVLYGWQDALMKTLDGWCRSGIEKNGALDQRWYADETGLRISGLLGMGTELFLVTVFSVVDNLTVYLYINISVMNGIWLFSILYRRLILRPRLRHATI